MPVYSDEMMAPMPSSRPKRTNVHQSTALTIHNQVHQTSSRGINFKFDLGGSIQGFTLVFSFAEIKLDVLLLSSSLHNNSTIVNPRYNDVFSKPIPSHSMIKFCWLFGFSSSGNGLILNFTCENKKNVLKLRDAQFKNFQDQALS